MKRLTYICVDQKMIDLPDSEYKTLSKLYMNCIERIKKDPNQICDIFPIESVSVTEKDLQSLQSLQSKGYLKVEGKQIHLLRYSENNITDKEIRNKREMNRRRVRKYRSKE